MDQGALCMQVWDTAQVEAEGGSQAPTLHFAAHDGAVTELAFHRSGRCVADSRVPGWEQLASGGSQALHWLCSDDAGPALAEPLAARAGTTCVMASAASAALASTMMLVRQAPYTTSQAHGAPAAMHRRLQGRCPRLPLINPNRKPCGAQVAALQRSGRNPAVVGPGDGQPALHPAWPRGGRPGLRVQPLRCATNPYCSTSPSWCLALGARRGCNMCTALVCMAVKLMADLDTLHSHNGAVLACAVSPSDALSHPLAQACILQYGPLHRDGPCATCVCSSVETAAAANG